MRIIFLHSNFPAQFVHMAAWLARNPGNEVVFVTQREEGSIPGVRKILYKLPQRPDAATPGLAGFETAIRQGQAVYRVLNTLKKQGFVPDVIYGHSGWGLPLFVKDVFPRSSLICLFEWYYHAHGTDADFDPANPLGPEGEMRVRVKNAPILLDLDSCDWGVSPTYWQHRQFPLEYQPKISVLHDGIDTGAIKPDPGCRLVLPQIGLDLSGVREIVTYVARGMEAYRGFPQFMEAVRLITEARPECHVVIVGADRVAYGKSLPDGKTFKQAMLEKIPLDLKRVHFTGLLPKSDYLKVLQSSSVHVYLTYPFVLSWSMLEAMAAGCVVVGSATPPVTEVITDGVNGLLTDFFAPDRVAVRVGEVLDHPARYQELRAAARQTVLDRYALQKLLPVQINLLHSVVARRPR